MNELRERILLSGTGALGAEILVNILPVGSPTPTDPATFAFVALDTRTQYTLDFAGKPTLRHVVLADLHDPRRLQELHRQAIAAELISQSECDRLRFFAAAEHAKAIGTRNPCGLFATIVRRKLWAFITQDDEEVANKALKHAAAEVIGVSPSVEQTRSPSGSSGENMSRAEIRAMVTRSLGEPAADFHALI